MRTIAVVNQKGGTGKTTTTAALAVYLSRSGSTLAVDCDAQGNLTQTFSIDPDEQAVSLANILLRTATIPDAAIGVGANGDPLSLVPGNSLLMNVWNRIEERIGRESRLRKALSSVAGEYRYCLIDCPPNLDETTLNALVAATDLVVPVDTSRYSIRGLKKLMQTLDFVREEANPDLSSPRLLICRADRTVISRSIEQSLRNVYGDLVFSVVVPRTTTVPESQARLVPLPLYRPHSPASIAYAAVAKEIEDA